jgi:AraC-like DNA-binding protein
VVDDHGAPASRGPLRSAGPGSLTLDRFVPDPVVASLVRHHWIARWSIPPGEVREQSVLEYPSGNLVFGPEGALLVGPAPGRSTVRLMAQGWVLGVLLQPAAMLRIAGPPVARLVGSQQPLDVDPEVLGTVVRELDAVAPPPARIDPAAARRAITAVEMWLGRFHDPDDADGVSITRIVHMVETDPALLRVDDLARRSGMTERALQRLVRHRLGVTPKWLIRRRRLQDAADRLHRGDVVDLAALAADLGFADQAHFTREFTAVTGITPAAYRDSNGDAV